MSQRIESILLILVSVLFWLNCSDSDSVLKEETAKQEAEVVVTEKDEVGSEKVVAEKVKGYLVFLRDSLESIETLMTNARNGLEKIESGGLVVEALDSAGDISNALVDLRERTVKANSQNSQELELGGEDLANSKLQLSKHEEAIKELEDIVDKANGKAQTKMIRGLENIKKRVA